MDDKARLAELKALLTDPIADSDPQLRFARLMLTRAQATEARDAALHSFIIGPPATGMSYLPTEHVPSPARYTANAYALGGRILTEAEDECVQPARSNPEQAIKGEQAMCDPDDMLPDLEPN